MNIFVKRGREWALYNDTPLKGSINDALQSLGYDHNQFYTYMDYGHTYESNNEDESIFSVCLKAMTEEIICILANDGLTVLTDADVNRYMRDFDFKHEYNQYSLTGDLDDAIIERNYSIQFVAEALGIPYSPDDKVLYSNRLKYNFFFEGGYLSGYEIADGYNREAHDMKDSCSWIYQEIESHARKYHGMNESARINEINIQCHAFYNVPEGIQNANLSEFQNGDGSYNFKMMLVTKYQGTEYGQGITYDDCKCICHNELKFAEKDEEGFDKLIKYRYRNYILAFDENGNLHSCEYNRSLSSFSNTSQSSQTGCMFSLLSILSFIVLACAVFASL